MSGGLVRVTPLKSVVMPAMVTPALIAGLPSRKLKSNLAASTKRGSTPYKLFERIVPDPVLEMPGPLLYTMLFFMIAPLLSEFMKIPPTLAYTVLLYTREPLGLR